MNLLEIKEKKYYQIESINLSGEDSLLATRFIHLGFTKGQCIKLLRKAPIFKDPILFEIEGLQVALTSREASLVFVKECEFHG